MTENKERCQYSVFVVNAASQDGLACRGEFVCQWNWIAAPADWTAHGNVNPEKAKWDAILVVAQKNQENEALALCKAIRENNAFDDIPLLVEVNIYQMPLAIKVSQIPDSSYIFTPIVEGELLDRMAKLGHG